MAQTVVALYDDFAAAERVVDDLERSGFPQQEISVVVNNADEEYERFTRERAHARGEEHHVGRGEAAGISAGAGAGVGGIAGLLFGAGLIAVPGVGPVLAVGPLVGLLGGAGLGAAAGGLGGALFGAGVPEEEAGYYAEGVRRGGTLVSVITDPGRVQQATTIMKRHNPVDIERRAEEWRSRGWSRHDTAAEPLNREELQRERQHVKVYDTPPESEQRRRS